MTLFFEVIFPVIVLIAIGYGAARLGRFTDAGVRALSDATFLIFMPALLFGALARVDFDALSPGAALAYYGASLPLFVGVIAVLYRRGRPLDIAVIRGLCAVFSNTAMLGIPLIRLVYGEAGLAYLLTIIALHALTFLTLATLTIEIGGGRAVVRAPAAGASTGVAAAGATAGVPAGRAAPLGRQLLRVVRASLIHPVVLPILIGLAWSSAGWSLPAAVAAPLGMLGSAAAPLCLVLLGASLAQFDLRRGFRTALELTALKSFVHPLLVWLVGRFVFGVEPLPLAVATVTAALPIGANVYLFAQRYEAGAEQTSAGLTLSTLVAAASLPVLLILLPGV